MVLDLTAAAQAGPCDGPGDDAPNAEIVAFYTAERDEGRGLYDIWEAGEAWGDSITPAVSCLPYRRAMARILGELCASQGVHRLVSVGVGNAAVEQLLVAAGIAVEAVDLVAQAVELARRKGVRAVQADARRWQPSTPVSVLYADGILGHLYDEGKECLDVLRHFATWLDDGGVIVASNDVPPTGERARPAPGVAHFHWLSAALLSDNLTEAGFTVVRTESFSYNRPLSGRRCRSIVVARR